MNRIVHRQTGDETGDEGTGGIRLPIAFVGRAVCL